MGSRLLFSRCASAPSVAAYNRSSSKAVAGREAERALVSARKAAVIVRSTVGVEKQTLA
jgi:hypothetical protein